MGRVTELADAQSQVIEAAVVWADTWENPDTNGQKAWKQFRDARMRLQGAVRALRQAEAAFERTS